MALDLHDGLTTIVVGVATQLLIVKRRFVTLFLNLIITTKLLHYGGSC